MIRQTFRLSRWDWEVTIYYAVHGYFVEEIISELKEMGIKGRKLKKARKNLMSGNVNQGVTYVNNGRALSVIGMASSADQYADSIQHEVMHLALFIGRKLGLNPYGEDVCYMGGEIARKMWSKSKLLTSECGCYTKRIGKEL